MDMKFRSKIDLKYYIIVITFTVFPILWLILWRVHGGSFLFAAVIFLIADIGIIYPVFIDTAYIFEPDGLRVKAGFITDIKIPYVNITGFRETAETFSSPALSRDRVSIDFRTESGAGSRISVSPARKAAFMEMLAEKAEHLTDRDREI